MRSERRRRVALAVNVTCPTTISRCYLPRWRKHDLQACRADRAWSQNSKQRELTALPLTTTFTSCTNIALDIYHHVRRVYYRGLKSSAIAVFVKTLTFSTTVRITVHSARIFHVGVPVTRSRRKVRNMQFQSHGRCESAHVVPRN